MSGLADNESLLSRISRTVTKLKVTALTEILNKGHYTVDELLKLTLHPDKAIAFRASWILETLVLTDPLKIIDHLETLKANFLKIEDESCQRHYVKIMMHLTKIKMNAVLKDKIDALDMEPVAERCFDLLIKPTSPIAVKVFACEALFNLRIRYDWIGELLKEQLIIIRVGAGPGVRVMSKRLLAQLP